MRYFVALQIILAVAIIAEPVRMLWALHIGEVKVQKVARSKLEEPEAFWPHLKMRLFNYVFFLLPLAFAVFTLPAPLPDWFKVIGIACGVIFVFGWLIFFVSAGLEIRKYEK